jgi:hypothetical protein
MNNLIIPAAGASSRFPDMKLKWLLTHPTGDLVIKKVLDPFNLKNYDRVIISVLREHEEKYSISTIIQQIFGNSVEVCVLEKKTKSAVETVYQTIKNMKLTGHMTIKDSDGMVVSDFPLNKNYVCGCRADMFDIRELHNKSFIVHNENNTVLDIQEKNIVSNVVCLGVFSLKIADFVNACEQIKDSLSYRYENEMYISHVISYMIQHGFNFECQYVDDFKDWGTIKAWRDEQAKHKTYFLDIDGVFLRNTGKYGVDNWSNTFETIDENITVLKNLSDSGAEIIFTTSRTDEYLDRFKKMLSEEGIKYKCIISGCNHSQRIIINDFALTNPYPSCLSISTPRNSLLKNYFIGRINE